MSRLAARSSGLCRTIDVHNDKLKIMPFLIDGYNLLRAVQKLDGFADLTDAQLCRYIADFLVAIKDRGMIVFDGIGPPDKRELMGIRGLEIRFSGDRNDADSYIEWKIDENTAPRRLMVVSSDRRLRNAATRRKATSIPVDVFWVSMGKALENHASIVHEPREKQKGIPDSETDAWMRYFKLDK